jgi:L-rhamnose mutarotase
MSKQEDANLILRLYELRRETVMREARNWFFTFNPTSVQDFMGVLMGEHSGHYRMVVSYWDMAASLVNHGAIDEAMFNDSNGEMVFIYAKIEPFLAEMRTVFNNPEAFQNLEKLVRRIPNIDARIAQIREMMKKFAAAREESANAAQA